MRYAIPAPWERGTDTSVKALSRDKTTWPVASPRLWRTAGSQARFASTSSWTLERPLLPVNMDPVHVFVAGAAGIIPLRGKKLHLARGDTQYGHVSLDEFTP
ncbi:hypothetical protein CSOJ01_05273 [Colletotrichum sojae]|uniref:Uncharacterized protein n=1 Tax=Colletotrichum sojae TaxID=2175907 RepID=A0A8H6MX06_9PEZI|nr:hypothetical protein CSOJ01_05273 [Colletotrichum sojae]